MNYSEQFIIKNNLLPGDAILLRKRFVSMFDHFAVYLGRDEYTNKPYFAANNINGVELITSERADVFLTKLQPQRIERFSGTLTERNNAIKRAISKIGRKGYNLITNNCEHYKNFVQYGKKHSPQVENIGKGMLVAGGVTAITGLASKNKDAALVGAVGLILGGILSEFANQND